MQGLAEAARRIGDVVGLIHTIAGQTNLLALNAHRGGASRRCGQGVRRGCRRGEEPRGADRQGDRGDRIACRHDPGHDRRGDECAACDLAHDRRDQRDRHRHRRCNGAAKRHDAGDREQQRPGGLGHAGGDGCHRRVLRKPPARSAPRLARCWAMRTACRSSPTGCASRCSSSSHGCARRDRYRCHLRIGEWPRIRGTLHHYRARGKPAARACALGSRLRGNDETTHSDKIVSGSPRGFVAALLILLSRRNGRGPPPRMAGQRRP